MAIPAAVCVLAFNATILGVLNFTQENPNSPVTITGTLTTLSPGVHGFHVHEFGDLGSDCIAAGAHFNPFNKVHGAPNNETRHVGDLGNIVANGQGVATLNITDSIISLCGPNSIVGRAMVVHADPDDLGLGSTPLSNSTGNAGKRVACGVIGIAKGSPCSSSAVSIAPTLFGILPSLLLLLVSAQFKTFQS